MICEVRDNGKEIALSHVTISDMIALAKLLFQKDKEVVFTRPEQEEEECQ